MVKAVKLRKGLDIRLRSVAALTDTEVARGRTFSLSPDDFPGVVPKVTVKEGSRVLAGDPLFVNKHATEVSFASPVSGVVTAVERGERRKVLSIKVEADDINEYRMFDVPDLQSATAEDVKDAILKAGLFGYITQLPYAVCTTPDANPKAIFVSAFRDMPLAADFMYELAGEEQSFQAGITALSKINDVYIGISKQEETTLGNVKDATVTIFQGKCPAGNVGVQINHTLPVNKGETVWTADPMTVIFIGRLFLTGKTDLRRKIAVAGSEVINPSYSSVTVGQNIGEIVKGRIKDGNVRIIKGNPLTGVRACKKCHIGPFTSEITVIPEGDDADEMLGWIMPRTNMFSASRTYLSWLMPKNREYDCDARIKGGERHMIMSGEYERVLPMDICAEHLIKAIITGDIERQEALGIYEVSPEDFAVAEFVCSSKLPLQQIVRQGLDVLRKENE